MSIGIICEYNPFHNGHLYHINKIREGSDEPIICVMSGNFTQRGELAVSDKYSRAEIAVRCGVDLVLELPFPYCVSSAEFFAEAGVKILSSCGADKLSFGSECADGEKLFNLAKIANTEEFKTAYSEAARSEGNARAYFEILQSFSDDDTEISSNDILGIEYIKAIIKNGYDIKPCPIKREGAEYTERELKKGEHPSASAVRDAISEGGIDKIKDFVPTPCFEILSRLDLTNVQNVDRGILLALRLLDVQSLENVAVSDEGLVNRIIQCAKEANTFSEFEKRVQCKKYTDSAIRRAMWYMLTGVSFEDLKQTPAYTSLLAANERGREILSELRKKDTPIPIITKPADASALKNALAQRQIELSLRADAIYSLAFENAKSNTEYIRKKPFMI